MILGWFGLLALVSPHQDLRAGTTPEAQAQGVRGPVAKIRAGGGAPQDAAKPGPSAETTRADRIEQAKATLSSPPQDPAILSVAIRELVSADPSLPGPIEFLCTQLRESPRADVRRQIIFELDVVGDPRALRECLGLLTHPDPELNTQARRYVTKLWSAEALRETLHQTIETLLSEPSTEPALVRGAAEAAREWQDFRVVPALVTRMEMGDGALHDVVLASLHSITLQRFGAVPADWRSWWELNKNSTREQLLSIAVGRLQSDLDRRVERIVELEQARLATAQAAECMGALKDDITRVRLAALRRLQKLAVSRNGERDAALEQAREIVQNRLRGWLDAPTEATPSLPRPEGEELRLLAGLLPDLAPDHGVAVRDLLAQLFVSVPATRVELLDAVGKTKASDGAPEILRLIEQMLDEAPLPDQRIRILSSLGQVGDPPSLDVVLKVLEPTRAEEWQVRRAALQCATEIALRTQDAEVQGRKLLPHLTRLLRSDPSVEVRLMAARELNSLVTGGSLGVPGRQLAFEAYSDSTTLDGDDLSRALTERCSRYLWQIPGFEVKAAGKLAGLLLAPTEAPIEVIRTLLTQIRDLAKVKSMALQPLVDAAVLKAVTIHLTRGGPNLEGVRAGQEAWEALRQLQEVAKAEGREVDFLLLAEQECEGNQHFAWAAYLISVLLRDHSADPVVASQSQALRLRRGLCLAQVQIPPERAAENAKLAWDELRAVYQENRGAATGAALTLPQKRELLLRLVEVAERLTPADGREGARYGAELLQMLDPAEAARPVFAEKVARLLIRGKQLPEALELLEREFDEATAPLAVQILTARASVGQPAVAQRRFQDLVGVDGRSGHRGIDAATRAGLVLEYATVLAELRQWREMRRLLEAASSMELGEPLKQSLQQLQQTLEDGERQGPPAAGGNGPGRDNGS